jgi:creatinine amidohydrolase
MHRPLSTVAALVLGTVTALAQGAQGTRPRPAAPTAKAPLVEFEMMTWPEVKAALEAGKTTALVYTGGTEQRGPQNVNGGHTLMGRETVKAIALRLGNAIAMPVLAYTPNNASPQLPGTICRVWTKSAPPRSGAPHTPATSPRCGSSSLTARIRTFRRSSPPAVRAPATAGARR